MFLVSYFSVHSQAHQAHDQIFAPTALGIMPASEIRCARPLAPAVRSLGRAKRERTFALMAGPCFCLATPTYPPFPRLPRVPVLENYCYEPAS